jgi:ribonuclease P/MRP protein subunit RPP40
MAQLRAHGVGGKVLMWIGKWLGERRQKVVLNGASSSWENVLSGVPQGSVLEPILSLLFINNIDAMVHLSTIINKFPDNTKLGQVVRSQADSRLLQSCLNKMEEWADTWGMSFNVNKCKVMHIGPGNPCYQYSMGGIRLGITKEERDIGVTVSSNLKPGAQCSKAAGTEAGVLGQISNAFHYRDRYTFVSLYKQYVRPHLEFVVQAWNPWTQQDKDILEKVHRRVVAIVSGLRGVTYEERLEELEMTTLEERRHRADMLHVFMILTEKDNVDKSTWFKMASEGTVRTMQAKGTLNLVKPRTRLEVRSNFFSIRVVEEWNKVPEKIKLARSVGQFKCLYNQHRGNRPRREQSE